MLDEVPPMPHTAHRTSKRNGEMQAQIGAGPLENFVKECQPSDSVSKFEIHEFETSGLDTPGPEKPVLVSSFF